MIDWLSTNNCFPSGGGGGGRTTFYPSLFGKLINCLFIYFKSTKLYLTNSFCLTLHTVLSHIQFQLKWIVKSTLKSFIILNLVFIREILRGFTGENSVNNAIIIIFQKGFYCGWVQSSRFFTGVTQELSLQNCKGKTIIPPEKIWNIWRDKHLVSATYKGSVKKS